MVVAALLGICSMTSFSPDSENGPPPTTGAVPLNRGVADPGVVIGIGFPRGIFNVCWIS